MLIQTIRILAVTPISRPSAGLHERHAVRLRPKNTQERLRMHRARANFHIVRLLQHAILIRPELREAQNQILKIQADIFFLKFYFNFQIFSKSSLVASFLSA